MPYYNLGYTKDGDCTASDGTVYCEVNKTNTSGPTLVHKHPKALAKRVLRKLAKKKKRREVEQKK